MQIAVSNIRGKYEEIETVQKLKNSHKVSGGHEESLAVRQSLK